MLRDLTDDRGGFYCAEDADSEGMEGKFYLWTPEKCKAFLQKTKRPCFCPNTGSQEDDHSVQGMQEFPEGQFIPHPKRTSDVDEKSITTDHSGKMESIRKSFFTQRKKRIHPHKDDKILTDWNGLMIALARGAQVFDEPEYTQAALRAMEFITRTMQTREGRLLHRYREGQAAIAGNLDDYSFFDLGASELYEATFDATHVMKALEYQSHLFARFRDERSGGFFFYT